MSEKDKPLIEMSKLEMQDAFDEMGREGDISILQNSREGKDQDIILALAILIMPDGTERLIMADCEYGDGEGLRMINETIAGFIRMKLLKHGESLRRDTVKVVKYQSTQQVTQ